jgi:hypothetical protein
MTLTLTNVQLIILRSLVKNGWPADLIDPWVWSRNGGEREDWQALVDAGLVEPDGGGRGWERFRLTAEGKREYQKQRIGKWF